MALRFPQDLELYGKNDLHENLQSDVLLITGVSRGRKSLEDFIRIPHEEGFFHAIEAITKLHHNITWQMVYVHDITEGSNPSAPLHTPLRVVISKTLTEGLYKLGGKNPACWLHLGHGQEQNGVYSITDGPYMENWLNTQKLTEMFEGCSGDVLFSVLPICHSHGVSNGLAESSRFKIINGNAKSLVKEDDIFYKGAFDSDRSKQDLGHWIDWAEVSEKYRWRGI